MDGQISIFDLFQNSPTEWEWFRDEYCKKQAGFMRFDNEGRKTTNDNFPVVRGCCFTPRNIKEPWDNWRPCTYGRCPFVRGMKGEE